MSHRLEVEFGELELSILERLEQNHAFASRADVVREALRSYAGFRFHASQGYEIRVHSEKSFDLSTLLGLSSDSSMNAETRHRLSINFSDDDYTTLEKEAQRDQCSRVNLLRKALRFYDQVRQLYLDGSDFIGENSKGDQITIDIKSANFERYLRKLETAA